MDPDFITQLAGERRRLTFEFDAEISSAITITITTLRGSRDGNLTAMSRDGNQAFVFLLTPEPEHEYLVAATAVIMGGETQVKQIRVTVPGDEF